MKDDERVERQCLWVAGSGSSLICRGCGWSATACPLPTINGPERDTKRSPIPTMRRLLTDYGAALGVDDADGRVA